MKRRGMTLVVVLLIMALIVTMGMAYLGRRAPQYEGAYQASLEVQAKALAEGRHRRRPGQTGKRPRVSPTWRS